MSYLSVPEAFPGPRLSEYLCVFARFEPGNLLCVPFELLYEFWINEAVHDPVP